MDKENLKRQVSFIPSEFSAIGPGEKPGATLYMNAYTEEILLEQLVLEVDSEDYTVKPSYAYFLCDKDSTPNMYIGSSLYRSVFSPIDRKTKKTFNLDIPVQFAVPLNNNQ